MRRFWQDTQGSTTAEFVIVAPLVLYTFFWIVELGHLMTQQMMLDRALNMTMREMRISDDESFTQDFITNSVCDKALIFKDCNNSLVLELTPIESAADIPTTAIQCVNRADEVKPVTSFNPGERGELVFMRACMAVDPILGSTQIGMNLSTDESGALMLVAKTAFLNEPE